MCFPRLDRCPVEVFSDLMVLVKTLNLSLVYTYGVVGYNIFSTLFGLWTSHKCFLMFFWCTSCLTLIVSFIPLIVLRKFFARSISQCMASNVYRMSKSSISKRMETMANIRICHIFMKLELQKIATSSKDKMQYFLLQQTFVFLLKNSYVPMLVCFSCL